MPGGELADDEQAELVALGEIELRCPGQPLVELLHQLRRHAQTAVHDVNRIPPRHP